MFLSDGPPVPDIANAPHSAFSSVGWPPRPAPHARQTNLALSPTAAHPGLLPCTAIVQNLLAARRKCNRDSAKCAKSNAKNTAAFLFFASPSRSSRYRGWFGCGSVTPCSLCSLRWILFLVAAAGAGQMPSGLQIENQFPICKLHLQSLTPMVDRPNNPAT